MKKFSSIFILSFLLLFVATAYAGDVTVFGPKQYLVPNSICERLVPLILIQTNSLPLPVKDLL